MVLVEAPVRPSTTPSGEWVLCYGATDRGQGQWQLPLGVSADGPSLRARVGNLDEQPLISIDRRARAWALVDGLLNLDEGTPSVASPSSRLLTSYLSGGDYQHSTRGSNLRVIVDANRRELRALRDPLGTQPLFYTCHSGGVAVSPSLPRLLDLPGVGRELNRAALADHLCGRWPDPSETYYHSIRRVPPGHVLIWREGVGAHVERYWDPYPADRPVPWLTRDEIGLFDRLFERAVSRSAVSDTTGIYLSGGLDSVSVAALAADLQRRAGRSAPVALCVGFPHDCDEETVQRRVASQLGLPLEFLSYGDALGKRGLIDQALDMGATMSQPMMHTWSPVYSALTRRARARGVDVILTGGGGDEWLSISPLIAADYLRSGSVLKLARFVSMWWRSYPFSPVGLLRTSVWRFGLRPLSSMWLGRVAPNWWQQKRRERYLASTPDWVAADPQLRREIDERAAASMQPTDPAEGFYLNDIRRGMSHPLTSMEFEESEEFSRRHQIRKMRPFFDVDLVELLYRTPPELLTLGGRAKGLVRDSVARRFPTLGFERQKKKAATKFFRSVLCEELPALWARDGGPSTLIELGVVERGAVERLRTEALTGTLDERLYRAWSVFNLEHWVRSRV